MTCGGARGAGRGGGGGDRWPVALGGALGPGDSVSAEGLKGGTTVFGDPKTAFLRAGSDALPTLLHTHQPLDLVIIMLGTNDIMVAEVSARAATRGMARLVQIIRTKNRTRHFSPPLMERIFSINTELNGLILSCQVS